jgi:aldose 1-epimerase
LEYVTAGLLWNLAPARLCCRLGELAVAMVDIPRSIERDVFGHLPDGRVVERVTLRGGAGFEARILTYGATLQALMALDRAGRCEDVVLGHDDLAGYVEGRRFFGVTIGRYANRIANSRFVLDGQEIRLAANDAPHSLHGGPDGFDRQLWQITGLGDEAGPHVTLAHVSPDGEGCYPGRLEASVTYRLTGPAELTLSYEARTDRPTIVNLTNHSFFNLDGGACGVHALDHVLTIRAERYLAIDDGAIPLPGYPRPVAGTPFDFRSPMAIGARIRRDDVQLRNGRGYDHNFCLGAAHEPQFAARLEAPRSGRVLELWTDQPGLQFYSGNYLDGSIAGKRGVLYRQSDGVCLEPQIWPDAPNRADYPSARLAPDGVYRHRSIYRFRSAQG